MSEKKTDTWADVKAVCAKFNEFVGVDWVAATPITFEEVEIEVVFNLIPYLTGTTMSKLELWGLISGGYSREEVLAYVTAEAFRDWGE